MAFNFSFGNHVSWYPLSYHHRDPRSRRYDLTKDLGRPGRYPRFNEIAYLRAVSSAPIDDFGGDGVRFKSVNQVTARRILNDEPMKGDLPLRPTNVYRQKVTGEVDTNLRITQAKPRVKAATDIVERPTGAAIRKAGLPLDEELRRARVFGGREPKSLTPENKIVEGATESRSTGAVTRSPKTINNETLERGGFNKRGDQEMPRAPKSESTEETGVIKRDQEYKGRRERVDENNVGAPVKTPKTNDDADRPAKTVRPQSRERDDNVTPRYDPPVRKYEPPPSQPAPKHEPPPQRSAPPSAAPVQKSAPAPTKSAPAEKSAPAKSAPAPTQSAPAKVVAPSKVGVK